MKFPTQCYRSNLQILRILFCKDVIPIQETKLKNRSNNPRINDHNVFTLVILIIHPTHFDKGSKDIWRDESYSQHYKNRVRKLERNIISFKGEATIHPNHPHLEAEEVELDEDEPKE